MADQQLAAAPNQRAKRKRKPRPPSRQPGERSLSCVVQALTGRKLVVELRNDAVIRGKLDEADDYMNLYMSDVTCQDVMGRQVQCEFLYIKARNIRFLHLPKSLDPAAAVEQQRQKLVQLRVAAYKDRQRQQVPSSSVAKGDAGSAYVREQQQQQPTAMAAGAARAASSSVPVAGHAQQAPAAVGAAPAWPASVAGGGELHPPAQDALAAGQQVSTGQHLAKPGEAVPQHPLAGAGRPVGVEGDEQEGGEEAGGEDGALWGDEFGQDQLWARMMEGDGDDAEADSEGDDEDEAAGVVGEARHGQGVASGTAPQPGEDDEGFDFD